VTWTVARQSADRPKVNRIIVERQGIAKQVIALHEFDLLRPHEASLLAGCTTRGGGVSEPPYDTLNLGLHVGDEPDAVLENRRRLAVALGVELSAFVFAQQVHGGEVCVVTATDGGRGALRFADALPNTDALITRDAGVVLTVMHADCVPVVLFDPLTPALGVVHAGWGGAVNHVVRNAVEAMRMQFASDPATLVAGIGPSIGPASYEVGPEVAERVRFEFPGADLLRTCAEGKFLLDLWGAATADLASAGLSRESIEVAGLDTFQLHSRFFSHRRGQPTGRGLTFAMLRS
jgi:YfiH family protein